MGHDLDKHLLPHQHLSRRVRTPAAAAAASATTPTSGLSSPSNSDLSLVSPSSTAGQEVGNLSAGRRAWRRHGDYNLVPGLPLEGLQAEDGDSPEGMPPPSPSQSRYKRAAPPTDEDEDGGLTPMNDPNKRIKLTSEQRLERSRERNRIHARKTRQRKKLQMEKLQETLDQLKVENNVLRRELDERIAAIKLLVMRSPDEGDDLLAITDSPEDRDSDPLADTLSEGGSSTSKTTSDHTDSASSLGGEEAIQLNGMILGVAEMAEMDIDLELMKKNRSECTPEELEQIRRERNRMHAKRTRVRKKAQLEDIQDSIATLEKQNQELMQRISRIHSQSAHVTVTGRAGGLCLIDGEASSKPGVPLHGAASQLDARKTIG